jgi:hypothetical protein
MTAEQDRPGKALEYKIQVATKLLLINIETDAPAYNSENS